MSSLGLLQGFDPDQILNEKDVSMVVRIAYNQALHLALLGLAPEADRIIACLPKEHADPPPFVGEDRLALRLLYHVRHLPQPFGNEDDEIDDDEQQQQEEEEEEDKERPHFHAGHLLTHDYVSELQERFHIWENSVLDDRHGIPKDEREWWGKLEKRAEELGPGDNNSHHHHGDATTGSDALDRTAALAGMLYLLQVGGGRGGCKIEEQEERDKKRDELIDVMAGRIHANGQASYLGTVEWAWREGGLLEGKLRRRILFRRRREEGEEGGGGELRDYAVFILETLKKRFEGGMVHADVVYEGKRMGELLAELERNTMADEDFDAEEYGLDEEESIESILKEPASDEAIAEAERKMGRELPAEVKEFLRITNGCARVKTSAGFRDWRFVPVEDMEVEDEGYMDEYGFSVLPPCFKLSNNNSGKRKRKTRTTRRSEKEDDKKTFINFQVENWAADHGGAIRMYVHDGQGTEHTWIPPRAAVDRGKERVQEVYDQVDEEGKKQIDDEIVKRYTSREIYDAMGDCCVIVQPWGDPRQEVYPSFMSYLRGVVYASRPNVTESPVKMPAEL